VGLLGVILTADQLEQSIDWAIEPPRGVNVNTMIVRRTGITRPAAELCTGQ